MTMNTSSFGLQSRLLDQVRVVQFRSRNGSGADALEKQLAAGVQSKRGMFVSRGCPAPEGTASWTSPIMDTCSFVEHLPPGLSRTRRTVVSAVVQQEMETEDEASVDSPVEVSDTEQRGNGLRRSKSSTPVKKKRARGELSSAEKKQGPKSFQSKWLEMPEFRGWLQAIPGDPTKAKCVPCNATFSAGKSDAEKHAKGQKHSQKVLSIKNTRPINKAFAAPTKEQKLEKEVKKAEISLAAFFYRAQYRYYDHLVELVKKIFHDSEIAKRVTLDRTKCTAVMKNDLRTVPFSVLVDESTDVSNIKIMCLLTKYVSPSTGLVCTPLLEMIELDAKDCTAEAIYQKFKEKLCEQHQIPVTNCIGLGGVTTHLLKNDSPSSVLMDCICHSSHIAASAACKKLPSFISTRIRRVVSYVSGSPKRSAILEEFRQFFSEEPRKLVSISQARWLVMHSCVVRLLENLSALEHFFLSCAHEDNRDRDAPALYEEMRNPYFKAGLLFLKYSLEYFKRMNALFQSAKVLVHRLQTESRQLLVQVCQNYMRPNVLESAHKITYLKVGMFYVPLEKMYLGPGTAAALEQVPLPNDPGLSREQQALKREQDIKVFKLKCLDFYITAADQLKMYLPLNSDIMREAAFIDPALALSANARIDPLPELTHLIRQFKDCGIRGRGSRIASGHRPLLQALHHQGFTEKAECKAAFLTCADADLYRLLVALCAPQVLESAGVSFTQLLELLDEHWEEDISEAMAEFVFEQRRQKPGESAADWLADLRQLAIPCKFTDLDRRLRAQLVRGVADKECQRKLLEAPDLTVKSALGIIRVHMRTRAECEALNKRNSTEPEVHEAAVMYVQRPNVNNECFRCGSRHNPDTCWARDADCRKCGRRGHLGRRCKYGKKGGPSVGG
ncbi:LOW QUALITY PROTEIN: Protein FAM200B [Frankliniella fusca]|uniref:Protein FAM200B n=1 Tax=Frankliniella fusca TaxID=407009 RepID=A0AAE1LV27_9NEOP|nr:LOW QUALITY PROTEIN: Protein FAM200B [Frankliniella fusca]